AELGEIKPPELAGLDDARIADEHVETGSGEPIGEATDRVIGGHIDRGLDPDAVAAKRLGVIEARGDHALTARVDLAAKRFPDASIRTGHQERLHLASPDPIATTSAGGPCLRATRPLGSWRTETPSSVRTAAFRSAPPERRASSSDRPGGRSHGRTW